MADEQLIQQIKQALADLKVFAETNGNIQLLDHVGRLEGLLTAIASDDGFIRVGNISGSTAVAIGHDINIIINQVLPADVLKSWETLQSELSQTYPQIRSLVERQKYGHVFLSYCRADMDTALAIRRALEDAGHIVWQDLAAIKGSAEWIRSIGEGVEYGYALVTVVSELSQQSEWVQIEYLHAKRRNKRIVPIKIDASEIPTMLLTTNIIDAYPDFESGVKQLLATLPIPPMEGFRLTGPADQRALEIRYLDQLLLAHSVWQEVYTPMAGVAQMRVAQEYNGAGIHMKTAPTTIDVSYLRQMLAGDSERVPRREKRYEADITLAVHEMQRLVILGDPGAGKTTTLWKILSDYAGTAKTSAVAPLPVFVDLGAMGGYDNLEMAIRAQLGPLAHFYDDLLDEKRLAFLLDGLNELPAAGRNANLDDIKALIEQCRKNNLTAAVTCRELDYGGALNLGLAERVIIQPLDPIRIWRFVNAYIEEPPGKGDELFWQLAGEQAYKAWQQFKNEVGDLPEVFWQSDEAPKTNDWVWSEMQYYDWLSSPRLRRRPRTMLTLASNPYMLYMMIQVFTQTGALPRNRGLLFQTFVDYLLEKRERLSQVASRDLKTRLAGLAYAMQAKGEGTTFSTAQVMEHLRDAQRLYQARSASILSGDEDVRFTHQLLQEYFAAQHLQIIMDTQRAEMLFPPESWWEPQGWEETVILLAGLYSDDCTPVIDWLKEAQPEAAARCIVESGAYTPDATLEAVRSKWMPRLTDLKHDPYPKARAAVGRALGRLRLEGVSLDSRPGVGLKDGLPDIDWVDIPGVQGWTMVGGDRKKYGPYDIAPFRMAKYLVTYAQFRVFLDAGEEGWVNPRWWEGLDVPDEHRAAPGEQAFKYGNHPRENVSWWDAMAFCAWLSARLGQPTLDEWLKDGKEWLKYPGVRLPAEWEWQWAAQGPDGRKYPYAGPFDPARGNTGETGIGQTSSVGIFPAGASPHHVQDLSGNVWEWCLNEYDTPAASTSLGGTAWRVVRGGSWYNDQHGARACHRVNLSPDGRFNLRGFRVCVRRLISVIR